MFNIFSTHILLFEFIPLFMRIDLWMMSTKRACHLPLNGLEYHKATECIRISHFE